MGADVSEKETMTPDDSKSPGWIRAVRGGRSRAPLGDLVCPTPPSLHECLQWHPLPTSPKGVIFAWPCHAPLLSTNWTSSTRAISLTGTRPQLTLWQSCYGTKRTSWTWSWICCKLTQLTHTNTHLHTCGNKNTQATRVRLDHDGYRSRGGQGPWYWAICQGGEFCVCLLAVCVHHKPTLDQFSAHFYTNFPILPRICLKYIFV